MKSIRKFIILAIMIITGVVYAADAYLDIDIFGIIFPDEEPPVIDTTGINTTILINGTVDTSMITCTDNKDKECEVVIEDIDTTTEGEKNLKVTATDSSGNFSVELIGITVLSIDDVAPVIDIATIPVPTSVALNGTIDVSTIQCTDNVDAICTVEVYGTYDTSVAGDISVTLRATDSSGNYSEETITVKVVDGVNTLKYVPDGYYNTVGTLTGEPLKDMLNDIITDHTEFPYTDKDLDDMDVWKMLRDADEDPNNTDNVIMFYSAFSWPKECQDTNTSLLPDYCFEDNNRDNSYTEWNREHIWSKSHGDFEDEDGYVLEDSFGGYALGAHTDGHHLVAAERAMNSTKNNRFFDDCHDGVDDTNVEDRGFGNFTCGEWYFEPRDEVKGDVARMLFYMATRYEGEDGLNGDYVDLELTTDLYLYEDAGTSIKNSKLPYYENLEVLLQWHIDDPVDEWEIERNQSIYLQQGNRNPFIDHPEYVAMIWGTPENPVEYVSTTTE